MSSMDDLQPPADAGGSAEIIEGVAAEVGSRSIADLQKWRDRKLIEILKGVGLAVTAFRNLNCVQKVLRNGLYSVEVAPTSAAMASKLGICGHAPPNIKSGCSDNRHTRMNRELP